MFALAMSTFRHLLSSSAARLSRAFGRDPPDLRMRGSPEISKSRFKDAPPLTPQPPDGADASGGWTYRYPYDPLPPRARPYYDASADAVMLCMWGWMFWHCLTEPEHAPMGALWFGDSLPDPTKWTDEELGIADFNKQVRKEGKE